jgi:hypothetical protein
VRRARVEHSQDPMNPLHPVYLRAAESENQFPACNSRPRSLEQKLDTARCRTEGGELFASTILFACWSKSPNPEQCGVFFGIIGACKTQSLVVLLARNHKIDGFISLMNDGLEKLVIEK